MTKIAVPIWNGRISPVFDSARRLLVVETTGKGGWARSDVELDDVPSPWQAVRLARMGVNVLICGAISRPLAASLEASGIKVIPFVSGQVEEILEAHRGGQMIQPRFAMPGCRRQGTGRACGAGGRRRRGLQW